MAITDTTIIIPQRGHTELTHQCLQSLRQFEELAWPVIVVDDGSPPESLTDFTIEDFPPAELILQSRSGVSSAWNRGAALAETSYLVFLNNDTISTGPWVEQLIEPLRRNECALVGAATRIERALPTHLQRKFSGCAFVEGWCMAVSRTLFEGMSGFNEALRVYWSDTDFQLRTMIEQSERFEQPLQAVTGLPLRHLGHRTAHDRRCLPQQRRQWCADRAMFLEKWRRM